jgi:hypothetical protein
MGTTTPPPAHEPKRAYEVEWTTISYRTIAFYVFILFALIGFVAYLIAPQFFSKEAKRLAASLSAGIGSPAATAESQSSIREAHFLNLDGDVSVRKAQSQKFIRADYNMGLERGDFVKTGSDGVARIVFADGTNYVLKADSLIAVEESREDPVTKATKVSVQVTAGVVDLSTGKFDVAGSTSQVSFENATATLSEDSRASVHNDPKNNVHQLTVNQGEAEIQRGTESVRLGQYDQVTFKTGEPHFSQSKVIAPPDLVDPKNMALTVSKDPKTTNMTFSWNPVPGAMAYRLQISPSGMFANLVVDKKVAARTSTDVTGLVEGTYYWVVSSIDAKGVESQASPPNRFNLVQEVGASNKVLLEISKIVQHGRVVEVVGRTEPGSTVIINNEQVFSIFPDGTFRHFTSPLPKTGENQITITAQNRKGDTNTIHKTIIIEE